MLHTTYLTLLLLLWSSVSITAMTSFCLTGCKLFPQDLSPVS